MMTDEIVINKRSRLYNKIINLIEIKFILKGIRITIIEFMCEYKFSVR